MKAPRTRLFWFCTFRNVVRLSLCELMAAALWFSCTTKAVADSGPQPTLRLDMTATYQLTPSQAPIMPSFYYTPQGQLALIRGDNGTYKPPYALLSDDKGRTWHNWEAFRTWPKMAYSDVVRRGDELLAFGHLENNGWKLYGWWSKDEGLTWAGGDRVTQDPKDTSRWCPMPSRVLLTSRGRVILPIDQLTGEEGPNPDLMGSMVSDDAGRSWKKSPMFGTPPSLPIKTEGFGEPAAVELANGKIWMVFRSEFGHLWQAWSTDGGATWGPPTSTELDSPISAVTAKRIPGSDAVVVVWNNAKPYGKDHPDSVFPRSPLVFAVSKDNCQTWSQPVVIEKAPHTAAYPSVAFSDTEMFVNYWTVPADRDFWMNSNAHLMVVAYDIQSLLTVPPSPPR